MSIFNEQPTDPDYLVGIAGNSYCKAVLPQGGYRIRLSCTRHYDNGLDSLILVADHAVDGSSVFPVFVRFKGCGHNGTADVGRRKKAKWYAFRYHAKQQMLPVGGSYDYSGASMLRLESYQVTDSSGFRHWYCVRGWHPSTGVEPLLTTLERNFVDMTNDCAHFAMGKSDLSGPPYFFVGWSNCGIALADKYGRLLSNVARLKIVNVPIDNASDRELRLYPMWDK